MPGRLAAVAAVLVMAALAGPAGASASFTELTPFDGSLVGAFGCPGPIAFDPGGAGRGAAVYVADNCANSDTGAPDVYAYTPDGTQLVSGFGDAGVLEHFTYLGSSQCFYQLSGVGVDAATGDLYVADYRADSLFDFDDSGMDAAQVGTPCSSAGPLQAGLAGLANPPSGGAFANPQGLAIYAGDLYVAGGGRLQNTALGFGASTVAQMTLAANDPNPVAVAIDPVSGNAFVVDGDNHLVDEYNSLGGFMGVFATGFGASHFVAPDAVAVDPVARVVYVADPGAGVVDTFGESSAAGLLQTPARALKSPDGVALDTANHVLYVPYTGTGGSGGLVEQFAYTPAPTCSSLSAATKGGVAKSLALACSDVSGATVTHAIASPPAHGTLSGFNPATGAVVYTPNPGFTGTDSFTATGASVDGTSDPATVSVTVTGPTCAAETLSVGYEAGLGVTLVCSDTASPVAAYNVATAPANGTLTTPTAGGSLTYTPNALFAGIDSFTYEGVSANGEVSAPTTITIYVGTPLPPPQEGESADLYFSYGNVKVVLPGQTTPIPLLAGIQAPLGSIVEAVDGGAGVFVEINGVLQSADFFNGNFKLTQSPDPHTILHLLGHRIPKVRCAIHPHWFQGTFALLPRHARFTAQIATKLRVKRKPTRQLWGSGHGNFTTVGNGSSASVRGTEWAIFDYPDGTLTFDFTDSVTVDDFHRHKKIVITAGHYYFAALGNLPPCH